MGKGSYMDCHRCGEELCWMNDYTFEDYGMEGNGIITVWHCLKCEADVEIYLPDETEKEDSDGLQEGSL